MSLSWNLGELRGLVKTVHGEQQLQSTIPHIDSVDWKIQAANYHSYIASRAFGEIIESDSADPVDVVKMLFSSGEDAQKYYEARLVYEASVIACAQSVHSVSDIISYVIFHALALSIDGETDLNLKLINKHVPESNLKESICRILGLTQFLYLRDFVNTAKHIQMVSSQYSVDMTGEERYPHGLKFREFNYRGRSHTKKWGEDFLLELRSLSIEFIQLGNSLNAHLEQESH